MQLQLTIAKIALMTTALLMPFASSATDAKIISFEVVTQGSTTQGAITEYSFAIEFAQTIPSGTTVSILANEQGSESMDMSRLLDFSGADASSSTLTFTGSTSSGTAIYELFLTADATAGKHAITVTGVANPLVDVCLIPAATTVSLPGDVTSGETGFTVGSGTCGGSGDDGDGSGDDNGGPADDGAFVLTAIGNNIVVTWEAYTGVATYGLYLDLDDNMENGNVTGVDSLTETTYVFSDLTANTTYYVAVNGEDSDGNFVIVPYPVESVETGAALDSRQPDAPSMKKIKSTEAKVQWGEYSSVEQVYLSSIKIRVKKGKKKMQMVSATSSATLKKIKELKPETKYTVQYREVWNINDTVTKSKWSKKKSFTTKKK